jgi:hypothetical protein
MVGFSQLQEGWEVTEGNLGFPLFVYPSAAAGDACVVRQASSPREVTERNLGFSLFVHRRKSESKDQLGGAPE